MISISGFVASLRTPVVRSRPVQMAEIQTAAGDRATIGFGPADDFPVTLRKGDRVTVEGIPAEDASGKMIILADTLALRGQTWSIPEQPMAENENRVTGEVVFVTVNNVRGVPHQLAQVRTAAGRRVTVDLGSVDQLPQPVQKYDLITAEGMLVTVHGQRVLVATQYRSQPQVNSSVWR